MAKVAKMTEERDHAKDNAAAWVSSLAQMVSALESEADAESARERIQESPLSVQVRSGWASVGDELNAEEFEILLSTGGPALRIRGELDENGQPERAWLEYQDWGTGWTQYFDVEQSTLLSYCSVFYFGE